MIEVPSYSSGSGQLSLIVPYRPSQWGSRRTCEDCINAISKLYINATDDRVAAVLYEANATLQAYDIDR